MIFSEDRLHKLLDANSKLERELAAMELRAMDCIQINERQALNFAKCQAELAAAKGDAERYRWLRSQTKYSGETRTWDEVVGYDRKNRKISEEKKETFWSFSIPDDWRLCMRQDNEPTLDAAIDAARREEK